MDEQKRLEKVVVFSLETAQKMMDEYQTVIPFGVRTFYDKEDIIMKCYQEKYPEDALPALIDHTVEELRELMVTEKLFATVIVTILEDGLDVAIGLQIETPLSAVLFVYPCEKEADKWVLQEPEQMDTLIAPHVFTTVNMTSALL